MLGKRKKKRITVTPGRGAFIDSLYAVTPEELGAIKKKKAKRQGKLRIMIMATKIFRLQRMKMLIRK